jgi:PPOX class probable F420-dependent enzyme
MAAGGSIRYRIGAMTHPIASEKYVAFTTFRKDGSPKAVPVWIVDVGDGNVGLITSSRTWKAKRLTSNPSVLLQNCDSRGQVADGSTVYKGTGVAHAGDEYERVNSLIHKKYGFTANLMNAMYAILRLVGKGYKSDIAILITLDD